MSMQCRSLQCLAVQPICKQSHVTRVMTQFSKYSYSVLIPVNIHVSDWKVFELFFNSQTKYSEQLPGTIGTPPFSCSWVLSSPGKIPFCTGAFFSFLSRSFNSEEHPWRPQVRQMCVTHKKYFTLLVQTLHEKLCEKWPLCDQIYTQIRSINWKFSQNQKGGGVKFILFSNGSLLVCRLDRDVLIVNIFRKIPGLDHANRVLWERDSTQPNSSALPGAEPDLQLPSASPRNFIRAVLFKKVIAPESAVFY